MYRDREITKLDEAGRTIFRNQEMGLVWQQHHLLPEFTAEENVMMPLLIRGIGRPQASRVAEALLEENRRPRLPAPPGRRTFEAGSSKGLLWRERSRAIRLCWPTRKADWESR